MAEYLGDVDLARSILLELCFKVAALDVLGDVSHKQMHSRSKQLNIEQDTLCNMGF